MIWKGAVRQAGMTCLAIYRLRLLNDDGSEAVYYDFQCMRKHNAGGVDNEAHHWYPSDGSAVLSWRDL